MRKYTDREQWFINRIGHRVYRNPTTCNCESCANVAKNGIVVGDRDHAIYLSEIEVQYSIDGHPLQYFDTLEEAKQFESENTLKS